MILDKQLQLATAQAVTASANSTNYVDLTAASEIGHAELYVAITCDVAATAAGAATVQFQLLNDASSGFGTANNILVQSDAIPKAKLTVGMDPIFLPIPPGCDKQYVALNFNVGTGPLTAGSFSVNIVDNAQRNKNFAARNYS